MLNNKKTNLTDFDLKLVTQEGWTHFGYRKMWRDRYNFDVADEGFSVTLLKITPIALT
jgi:hypothetical protein